MTILTLISSPAPVADDCPQEVQALLKTATRHETPCGAGMLVWHVWTPAHSKPELAPLVLFHGGGGSWTHWLRNISALVNSGRRVYVPDLPGFGDSAMPPSGGDADALPEPLELGLSLLLGDQACDLVGFSFGGLTAGFLAARFPARVIRLFIVGAPGLGIRPEKPVELKAWRHLPDAAAQEAVHRSNLAALMLFKSEAITDTVLWLHAHNVQRERMKSRRLARTDALAVLLAGLTCPVFAVYGAEDVLYRGQMAALDAALRNAPFFKGLMLIESAGHWVQFERAGVFNEVLLGLLDG